MKGLSVTEILSTILLLTIIIVLGYLWTLPTIVNPKILVMPEKALLDESVEISIVNVAPHKEIRLEASCKNKDNDTWKSFATFQADEKGW